MKTLQKIVGTFLIITLLSVSCKNKKEDEDDKMTPVTPTDATAPVLTLTGDARITLSRNSSFEDPGATATDDVDGDISDKIIITNDLDSSKFGLYNFVYTVKDKAGNDAVPLVRNVEVIFGRDDYAGSYNVEMDMNCSATYQLNSPQSISAGSAADEIVFNNFLPLIGGTIPAKVKGRNVTVVPITLQSFLTISGNGEIDENGQVLVMNFTFENTLPFIGGTESCQATYTKL